MLPNHKYFKLFTNCLPVKGISRSVICDLQRRKMDLIPNTMLEMLVENERKAIGEIKEIYGEENESAIEEYFDFLIEKDYIFLCDKDDLDFFPPIDLTWDVPNLIENAIIDIDATSQHDFDTIFKQLEDLGCKAIHLRFYNAMELESLYKILDLLIKSTIESIDILWPYTKAITKESLDFIANTHLRVRSIVIHNAPKETWIEFKHHYLTVLWAEKNIDSHAHCGIIGPKDFSIHPDMFMESQQFNTCLNHKISIDKNGDIKNCPSLKESYGNIKNDLLETALEKPTFKKYWKINKDQIETCKECEFRHICTDCRAFLKNPENLYSKPLKCGYDPKTNEWEEWSENPLKEKAILQ